MRGPRLVTYSDSWDSPRGTPGGLHLRVTDTGTERIVTAEYNPQHAAWKWEHTMGPLADLVEVDLAEWWVARADVAFDIPEERRRFTLEGKSRRKVELYLPSGGAIETANLRATSKYPGVIVYDKAAERKAKGIEIDGPLTRIEVRVKPKETRWKDFGTTSLPPLGARVLRFHYEPEEFNMDRSTSLHFAHLQELATYNPVRARQCMEELATSKGMGKEAYECLLDEIQIERIWELAGRDAVEVIETPSSSSLVG